MPHKVAVKIKWVNPSVSDLFCCDKNTLDQKWQRRSLSWITTVAGGRPTIVKETWQQVALAGKLREYVLYHRCERVNWKGEAYNLSKHDPVTCFFQQGCTSSRFHNTPPPVPNSATYWGPRVHTCLSPWFLQYLPMWSHLFCDHKSFLKLIEIKFICLAQFSPLSLNLQIQFPCLHFFLEVPKKFKTQIFAFLTIIYSLHHMSIILMCECRHTHAM